MIYIYFTFIFILFGFNISGYVIFAMPCQNRLNQEDEVTPYPSLK